MPELAFVALGSNVGDREGYLATARDAIAGLVDTRIVAESDVEETDPLGPPGQARYLNQMLAIETDLDPQALLAALQQIERANGRTRGQTWGARTLDLDIVRFGDRTVSTPGLSIPHPELKNRDFWQRELAQLGA